MRQNSLFRWMERKRPKEQEKIGEQAWIYIEAGKEGCWCHAEAMCIYKEGRGLESCWTGENKIMKTGLKIRGSVDMWSCGTLIRELLRDLFTSNYRHIGSASQKKNHSVFYIRTGLDDGGIFIHLPDAFYPVTHKWSRTESVSERTSGFLPFHHRTFSSLVPICRDASFTVQKKKGDIVVSWNWNWCWINTREKCVFATFRDVNWS